MRFSLLGILTAILLFGACQNHPKQEAPKHLTTNEAVEIAIMLPISESNRGKRAADFISKGINDGLGNGQVVNITIYDISSATGLDAAIQEAIKKNTKIILGPIFSDATMEIATKINNQDITIFSLSNDTSIARNNIFIFGQQPFEQILQIFRYLSDAKYKNIILLAPRKSNSSGFTETFAQAAVAHGLNVIQTHTYEQTADSIDDAVLKTSETIDNLNEDSFSTSKTAIYIADDRYSTTLLFNSIKKLGLDEKALLCGDNKIDINYSKPIRIVFTGSTNFLNTGISDIGQDPDFTFFDKVAYDLGSIVIASINPGQFNKVDFHNSISSVSGFMVSSGIVRFHNNIAERKFDIVVKSGKNSYKTIKKYSNWQ